MGIVLQRIRFKQSTQNRNELETSILVYINIGVGFFHVRIGRIVVSICAWCERHPIMLYWYKRAGLIGGYKVK